MGRRVACEDAAPIVPESDELVAACRDGSFCGARRHADIMPVSKSRETTDGVDNVGIRAA